MFDQLLVFLDKLFFFIPRPHIVQVFEGAVFLRCGKHKTKFWFRRGKNRVMKSLEPGIYILLPIVDDIRAITKVDQAVDLKNQSLLTRDGKNVVVSGTIRYHIDKPQKALLEVYDMDVTLSRVGLGVIADYVNTKTLAECTELEKLKAELMMKMCAIAKEWGIHVDEVYITDIGTTFNFRLLTNTDSNANLVF
jgi:regulator of protease activity HflC (stomatin/prohibitin superfamily)